MQRGKLGLTTDTEPNKNSYTSTRNVISPTTYTIAVVGLGYVGLPLALRADTFGHSVIGIDVNPSIIAALQTHKVPHFLDEAEQQLARNHGMKATAEVGVVSDANAIIICVPTPVTESHKPDLTALLTTCKEIAPYVKKNTLIIVESTVNPGVCEEKVLPIFEKYTPFTIERDLFFAHCPERINPGDSFWRLENIPRVIGGSGPKSLQYATALYETLIDAPLYQMHSIKEAEAVKMVENTFRDINIAFVNELAMSFEKAGIDVINVIQGAATKPFGFMPHYPGCGVGGHCIPVDPYYLIDYAQQNGFQHRFLQIARDVNNTMPNYTVDLLETALHKHEKTLSESSVALLGLAYKRDIPDMRESPAIAIKKELEQRGASVSIFDPFVPEHSTHLTLHDALDDVDAVVLATDHSQFQNALTPELFLQKKIGILVDGRNALSKHSFERNGITYKGIGR